MSKDLEKIKSEDLAAQVQDANPGNFAIEQEVAQLVGATVPAPTEPSADDARELGAQLLVFLRRALTPIRSALRTAVAAIYAHLDSRCTDYTPAAYDPFRLPAGPYDPMRPFVPRTLPNLLTALTAFSARKISNGSAPNDGIKDGTSLAHLLLSSEAASVTELKDDNHGWTATKQLPTMFSGLKHITLNCKRWEEAADRLNPIIKDLTSVEDVTMDELEYIPDDAIGSRTTCSLLNGLTSCTEVSLKGLKRARIVYPTGGDAACMFYNMPALKKVHMEGLQYLNVYRTDGLNVVFASADSIEELYLGQCKDLSLNYINLTNQTHLGLISFPNGLYSSMHLGTWNPTDKGTTFLQNFKEHIALRLTSNGSGKTLTLSQAVRDAIHAAEATYGIEAIIVTQKGWTLSPAPTA